MLRENEAAGHALSIFYGFKLRRTGSASFQRNSKELSFGGIPDHRSHRKANQRETIAILSAKINELEDENKKLNETVAWMHQTIWDLVRRNEK